MENFLLLSTVSGTIVAHIVSYAAEFSEYVAKHLSLRLRGSRRFASNGDFFSSSIR
jgi:hypothetical protein